MGRVNLCIVRFDSSAGRLHCPEPPRGRSPFNPASFVHFSLIYVLLKCHTARGHLFKLSTEIIENEAQKKGNRELGRGMPVEGPKMENIKVSFHRISSMNYMRF